MNQIQNVVYLIIMVCQLGILFGIFRQLSRFNLDINSINYKFIRLFRSVILISIFIILCRGLSNLILLFYKPLPEFPFNIPIGLNWQYSPLLFSNLFSRISIFFIAMIIYPILLISGYSLAQNGVPPRLKKIIFLVIAILGIIGGLVFNSKIIYLDSTRFSQEVEYSPFSLILTIFFYIIIGIFLNIAFIIRFFLKLKSNTQLDFVFVLGILAILFALVLTIIQWILVLFQISIDLIIQLFIINILLLVGFLTASLGILYDNQPKSQDIPIFFKISNRINPWLIIKIITGIVFSGSLIQLFFVQNLLLFPLILTCVIFSIFGLVWSLLLQKKKIIQEYTAIGYLMSTFFSFATLSFNLRIGIIFAYSIIFIYLFVKYCPPSVVRFLYLFNVFAVNLMFFFGFFLDPIQLNYFFTYNIETFVLTDFGYIVLFLGLNLYIAYEKKAQNINDMRKTLLDSDKYYLIGKLAGGVAHEINNPLNTIMNNVSLILDDVEKGNQEKLTGENVEFLREISTQSARIANITKNLLEFSRPRKGAPERQSLEPPILSVLNLLEPFLVKSQITISFDIPTEKVEVKVNYNEIQEIFLNLLTNSISALNEKYSASNFNSSQMRDRKIIKIRLYRDTPRIESTQSFLIAEVYDDGIGLSEDVKYNLFVPFFTTKKSQSEKIPESLGLGLGLHRVQSIIQSYSGKIKVDSKFGDYTSIKLYFVISSDKSLESSFF